MPLRGFLANSAFIKSSLLGLGIPEEKIVIAYPGIASERFFPDSAARLCLAKQFAIRPEERIVTTVSRLLPWKHTEVVLESIAILTRRKVPVRLFVAGDGVMRAQWEKLSKELSIADRVHWLGHLKDTSCLLRASDIFTLASEGEAFGFVLGEAMACGIPVVGSRSGSMPELIIDGETGFLAAPRNAIAFSDAIQKLCEDDELRKAMGRQGYQRIRQKFTADNFIEKTLSVILQ